MILLSLAVITNFKCVWWPKMDYKRTYDTTQFWGITDNMFAFGRPFASSFFAHSPFIHPYFYLSTRVFTRPYDVWTGLCIKLCATSKKYDDNKSMKLIHLTRAKQMCTKGQKRIHNRDFKRRFCFQYFGDYFLYFLNQLNSVKSHNSKYSPDWNIENEDLLSLCTVNLSLEVGYSSQSGQVSVHVLIWSATTADVQMATWCYTRKVTFSCSVIFRSFTPIHNSNI